MSGVFSFFILSFLIGLDCDLVSCWLGDESPGILGDDLSECFVSISPSTICQSFTVPLVFPKCHCGWDLPHCISPHHPPQPPPPARPNPLRQCVWSAPTIDRYIVPDRLGRATGQHTGVGGGRERERGGVGGGGSRECLFFCFQFGPARGTPHSAPSQTHHSWRPDVHDYTQKPTAHYTHTQGARTRTTTTTPLHSKPINLTGKTYLPLHLLLSPDLLLLMLFQITRRSM